MNPHQLKRVQQSRRRMRVRRKVVGTSQRPRLSVFRSLNHVYAQIIDDSAGRTLVAASSNEPELKSQLKYGGNCAAAEAVGKSLGQRAVAQGIQCVAFDRGHYKFHGRIQALADAVRKEGVQF